MNKLYLILFIATIMVSTKSHAIDVIKAPSTCVEDPSKEITPQMKRARQLYIALTGTPIPFCDDRLERMAIYLSSGRARDAVRVAIQDPDFYNIRIREMASKICTFEHSKRTPVNDCIAFFVGAIRDGVDAREFLTGNFWYRIDTKKAPSVPDRIVNDILRSNGHFDRVDQDELSMFHVLKKENGQQVIDPVDNNKSIPARDPAGAITTRAWMSAHARAGTNRRLVEKTFEMFLCSPIQTWADNTLSDKYVGRDVTRKPGDDPSKFLVTCKGCHAPMDSMRSVFSNVDWSDNNGGYFRWNPTATVEKMNRNTNETPELTYLVMPDARFDNLATQGANGARFGWRGATSGNGMNAFAKMIANSEQYNRCLVQHVFEATCGRKPEPELRALIDTYAADFDRISGTKDIRVLFERISLRPECTGDGKQ